MSSANNQQVLDLLKGAGKAAPEITHSLSQLGEGCMVDGLIALWENGQRNGVINGAIGATVVFTVGISVSILIKNKVTELRAKQAIMASCSVTKASYVEQAVHTACEPDLRPA